MCLDLYTSSLNPDILQTHIELNEMPVPTMAPLSSWDLISGERVLQQMTFEKEQDLLQIHNFAEKFSWSPTIINQMSHETFEAIIVTDVNQRILWVNKGFTHMTGYAKKEAINKTPRFLQGPETSLEAKKQIRSKLSGSSSFSQVLINYKKNQEIYKCEVKIYPMHSLTTSHFVAFEKQIL